MQFHGTDTFSRTHPFCNMRHAIMTKEFFLIKFKINFSLDGWGPASRNITAPALFIATLEVDTPYDTFLDMRGWGRGAVFINGFNLGRYFSAGPTHTLYLPSPLLKTGTNHVSFLLILVWVLHFMSNKVGYCCRVKHFWHILCNCSN